MRANRSMALLLREHSVDPDAVRADNAYPIRKKRSRSGRPYWVVSHFWNLHKSGASAEEDLSRMEWDGNDVYLDAHSKAEITGILNKGVAVMNAWRRQLERRFPETAFCILAAFDNGDMLENKEDFPDGSYSLILRFWAVRSGSAVVDLTCFDEWDQPALLDICNEHAIPASERSLYPKTRDSIAEGEDNG